jgi:hypothetical protein
MAYVAGSARAAGAVALAGASLAVTVIYCQLCSQSCTRVLYFQYFEEKQIVQRIRDELEHTKETC